MLKVKEIVFLIFLPLVLMSVTLAIIGLHSTKMINVNKTARLKQENIGTQISCENRQCNVITTLENIFIESSKENFHM